MPFPHNPRIKRFGFACLLGSAALTAGRAGAAVVATDGFETSTHPGGDRTVIAAPGQGLPFYTRNATGANYSASIVNDPTFGSNVLNHNDTTTTAVGNELIAPLPTTLNLLNSGDFVTLNFSVRLTNSATATAGAAGFRFGVESSNGTPVSADGQTTVSDNDQGFYAQTGVGSGQAPVAGNLFFSESGGTSPILGGTDRTAITASSAGVSFADNNVHTVSFTITRTNATTETLSASYDGTAAITGTTTTLRTGFDEIAFGDGFVASPAIFNLDNISVTSSVPEPTGAAVLLAGAGLFGLRRRRARL